MISEDNLDFLRQRGARYLVGTPKSQLRAFEAALLEEADWTQVQDGIEAKLVAHPDGGEGEQYLLCRSSARREKELAMLELQRQRLRAQLDKTHASLQRHPARDPGAIERRIGRWLGRFSAAERLVQVIVERDAAGQACGLQITERAERTQWAAHAHGAYLLRTNCPEQDPARFASSNGCDQFSAVGIEFAAPAALQRPLRDADRMRCRATHSSATLVQFQPSP